MNNENNNNNNYVAPKSVDLNNANLNEASDILSRERENIVSATLQANSSINEEEAKVVNNAIKVNKRNPFISSLIVFICLLIGGLLIFLVLKYSKEFIESEDKPTTTTTTKLTKLDKVSNYLNDLSKVRKFETSNRIIFLLPENFDLVNNNLYYFDIYKSESAVINQSYGTYTIVNDVLTLNEIGEKYEINESGIGNNDIILNIYDDEYKYYYNKGNEYNSLLLINGTLKCETSLYLTSTSTITNIIISDYIESQDNITLSNGIVFNKVDKSLVNNNIYLTLGQ